MLQKRKKRKYHVDPERSESWWFFKRDPVFTVSRIMRMFSEMLKTRSLEAVGLFLIYKTHSFKQFWWNS